MSHCEECKNPYYGFHMPTCSKFESRKPAPQPERFTEKQINRALLTLDDTEEGRFRLKDIIGQLRAENASLQSKLSDYLELQALELAHNELIPKLKEQLEKARPWLKCLQGYLLDEGKMEELKKLDKFVDEIGARP